MRCDSLNHEGEVQGAVTAGNTKKISVIVPCFNVESTIDRCLESIVKQTVGINSLEIILVNDASIDGTFAKLCEWEGKYPDSIMVINCKGNKRPGGARNIGMEYASGR